MKTVKMITLFLVTVYNVLFTNQVYAQKWTWGNLISAANTDVLNFNLTTDASGNLYMIGIMDEAPVFPNGITPMGGILPGANPGQGYLTKVNPSGTYLWASRMQTYNSTNQKVHVFSNGNVGVVGSGPKKYAGQELVFNGITYYPKYAEPAYYFALYDNNGTELVASLFEGRGPVLATSQVGDDVYVVVAAKDTLWYNNTYEAMPTGQQYGLFRLKFNSSGAITQVLRLGTDNYQFGGGMTVNVNALEETYIVLRASTADPGNGVSVPADGNRRVMAIKFDAEGKALWANYMSTNVSGAILPYSNPSVLDPENNLYIGSAFQDNVVINGQTYTTLSSSTYNPILFKLSDQGKVVWVDQYDKTVTNSNETMSSLTYNKGYIYATGQTSGHINFGPIFYADKDAWGTTIVSKIFYLLKVDTTGIVNKLRIYGNGTNEEQTVSLTTSNDVVYLAGNTMNEVDFDNTPTPMYIMSPNTNTDYKYNTYLARFDDCNAQITKNGTVLTASAGTSYQWNVNGSPIDGATSQTYDVGSDVSGKYTVDVTFAGGCVSRSATLPLADIVTGNVIADADQKVLSVYPNPTAGQLTVSLKLPADGHEIKVQVFNSSGTEVVKDEYTNAFNQTAYQMNVQDLPQGLYYVTLSNGADTYGSAFIKQ